MKRLFRFLLCIVTLAFFLTPNIAMAQSSSISTFAQPFTKASVTIRKIGNSIVAIASVQTIPYSVSTTVYLQQNIDNEWTTVSSNTSGFDVSTTTSADTGSSYQAYVICTIYDNAGNIIDTIYGYSTVLST